MNLTFVDVSLVVLVVLFLIGQKLWKVGRREHGLPPGPKTIPLLGNLHLIPTSFPQYKFAEWARQFGGIYSLKISYGTMIILSEMSVIRELIDKGSASSSNRPQSYAVELMTENLNPALVNSDTIVWRLARKAIQTIVTPQSISKHFAIIEAEASQLMYDLLHAPEGFFNHIPRFTFSIICSVTFGKRSPRFENRESTQFFLNTHRLSEILRPGALPPVDLIPVLKYIPEIWAPWKTACKNLGHDLRALYFGLLGECEQRLANGTGTGCYMEEMIQSQVSQGMTRQMLGWTGGLLLEGGSETTASLLQSFVLCLVAFPECLKRAQDEIDRVIGERAPLFADIDNLPYLQAILKEVHRFRPVLPTAVPHVMTSTQTCKGFIIPQDAIVFINIWGVYHDPNVFENPDDFWPERYLLTEYGTKPGIDDRDFRSTISFGGGRRICPGIHLANTESLLAATNLVWAFNFAPETGKGADSAVPLDLLDFRDGISYGPRQFQCKITPRSPAKAEMIDKKFSESMETFVKYECFLDDDDRKYVAETRKL